ncbi:TPA: maleylacetate reductase [Burkholderia cepacia]|uniref:maleylacetate reductase n=1 Tax=Burkholderia cepacia TaxID=292 RepID=UPI000759CB39|nr:maleylacetate reductase [Burkholderia cepacia]HDR9760070.1 maleylacetate reductase [Burkholderia cepacia ATCC 25416]KVH68386.1 maleylacetate reductase [Burkholderia cepacia]KWC66513.1 maleylacetate reductase [Burkholderia cepacia]MBY4713319.1 maleylacetate reductase [Burkholderia cepacia]MBY4741124.1 maleylacetate reductase [Burkholderia cepacia]
MVNTFTYQMLPARVVFGQGTRTTLAAEADRLGLQRLLVLSTPEQSALADEVCRLLGKKAAGTFNGAIMHTPVDVTERALEVVNVHGVDGIVAVGGGSTTGLGKAIALRTDLPQMVLPTTYAGSEMTPILGETQDGRKVTQRGAKIQPEVVIYDVDLTLSLPPAISALSAFNAIAHAAEALYAPDGNPIVALMAEEGVRAITDALPRVMRAPNDADARGSLLYGAWLCACCLGATTMGLHHKLCHTLGGLFDLPHAQTHAIVLPYALAYNAPRIPDALERLARAMKAENAIEAIFTLERECAIPLALRDIGMPEPGIAAAVEQAVANPYANPVAVEADALGELLTRAWHGQGI